MSVPKAYARRLEKLRHAFSLDKYTVSDDHIVPWKLAGQKIGLIAEHQSATCYENGFPKRVYYLEGSHQQMGFQMGWLAEPEIHLMTTTFIENMVQSMIKGLIKGGHNGPSKDNTTERKRLYQLLVGLIYQAAENEGAISHTPKALREEITGILRGCRKKMKDQNKVSKVNSKGLWALNVGIDILFCHAYSGTIPDVDPKKEGRRVQLPIACNALAVLNDAAADGALFGRDYMFPTGGLFEQLACLVIHNPLPRLPDPPIPTVSMTAPGFVGSVAAMNANGVAAGVDVSPSGNCNPDEIGLNSLLLVRHCIENGTDAEDAAAHVVRATRGVPWLYPIAGDGGIGPDRACVVEAGASHMPGKIKPCDPLDYYDPFGKLKLPTKKEFKDNRGDVKPKNGATVRWENYSPPTHFIQSYNANLWEKRGGTLYPDAFTQSGYINRTMEEKNCPSSYYFAPLRAVPNDIVITTNHFIIPDMRAGAFKRWTEMFFAKPLANDSQWRYDELNHQVTIALKEGPITYDKAKELIDFLSPYRSCSHYWAKSAKSSDGRETVISGSVSLFDLKRKTIESHFGYYCDEWIKLTLPNYIIP